MSDPILRGFFLHAPCTLFRVRVRAPRMHVRALCLSTRGMYDMYVGAAASLHSFDSGCIYVTLA